MMAKKKQPEPTLAERVVAFQAELEQWIDERAAALKRTRDGQDLPLWDLRSMLTRHDDCACRVVRRLSEEGNG